MSKKRLPKGWREGPPPHIGWWNASRSCNKHTWRWWDGEQWGSYCNDEYDDQQAATTAKIPAYETEDPDRRIKWHGRWPKGARVPRVNPGSNVVLLKEAA